MKCLLVVLAIVAYATSVPLDWDEDVLRSYLPEEEEPVGRRFFLAEDANGRYHVVDIMKEDPNAPRANINDLTFRLFTQANPNNPTIIPASNFNTLVNSPFFVSTRQNVFISHGWNNNHGSPVNVGIRTAILQRHNVNVFVIDWSGPANQMYTTARNAVPVIGRFVADFINSMMSRWSLTPARFNLVGHSLGAHLVGCAGAAVNGRVNWIVGLDPAGPLYTVGNIDNRIDPTDGDFVQIITTNAGLLGFSTSSGHADYFPNGGRSQPGCGLDLVGTCAHSRAHEFFAESILTGRFSALRCNSQSDFNNGRCNSNHRSFMGEWNVDRTARGDYFLATNSNRPFAQG